MIIYYFIFWIIGSFILICLLAHEIQKNYRKEIDEINYKLDYVEYVV
jgi:hypothetical protein